MNVEEHGEGDAKRLARFWRWFTLEDADPLKTPWAQIVVWLVLIVGFSVSVAIPAAPWFDRHHRCRCECPQSTSEHRA